MCSMVLEQTEVNETGWQLAALYTVPLGSKVRNISGTKNNISATEININPIK